MESQGYAASASERPISEGVGPEEPHQHAQVLEPPTSAVYGSDRMNGGSGYAGPPPLPEGWWKTGGETFLLIAWLTSLVATAVVAATINGPSVRILWFAVIIQTYTTFLVLQVLINPEPHPYTTADDLYGTQIALLATLACVFAVIGVDGNIYSGIASQQAAGAGWLLVAMTDLLWILYFTSPVDAPFARVARGVGRGFGGGDGDAAGVGESGGGRGGGALGMGSAGFTFGFGRGGIGATGKVVPKSRKSLGARTRLSGVYEYQPEFAVWDSERGDGACGHELQQQQPSSGGHSMLQKKRRSASGRWSSHTPGSGRDSHPNPNINTNTNTNINANVPPTTATATTNPNPNPNFNTLSTTRETVLSKGEGTLRPESGSTGTGTQIPFGGTAATQREGVAPPMSPAPIPEESKDALRLDPDAKWRAQAMFEYKGSKEDPQELVFKKGEILLIYDKSGKWWEAKNAAGKKGIVPSNYLQLL
ncbi:hypothetical protein CPB84DRAFT_1852708 [Gymnopilus junonius]|uniref:SH3 domain-containing protein n=1 Tax=Gymnopilus junonius TaxID=109634 RepID=A0A9P5TG88_GYMJU|nr:hypothetical protein CPB84DRAFT_1852708 [Gymnopilus junonius]